MYEGRGGPESGLHRKNDEDEEEVLSLSSPSLASSRAIDGRWRTHIRAENKDPGKETAGRERRGEGNERRFWPPAAGLIIPPHDSNDSLTQRPVLLSRSCLSSETHTRTFVVSQRTGRKGAQIKRQGKERRTFFNDHIDRDVRQNRELEPRKTRNPRPGKSVCALCLTARPTVGMWRDRRRDG